MAIESEAAAEVSIAGPATGGGSDAVPLCVDLDGTLVKSDTFYDSMCLLVRRHPGSLLRIPAWLAAGGRARVKAEVASLAPLDAAHLPWNAGVLRFVREQHEQGRAIYLATGADCSLAESVAEHLGLFAGVIASDGKTNFTHNRKLDGLRQRFAEFDYIGNSRADLPAMEAARRAYMANPTLGLRMAMKTRKLAIAGDFCDQSKVLPTVMKAVRLHQWPKNVLLFFPLVLSHKVTTATVLPAIVAFFCFGFFASANYLVNDLLDLESDRHHPKKRFRPFAAGNLSVVAGVVLAIALVALSCLMLPQLPGAFALWLLMYALVTSAYSIYLKRVPLVDVLVLSGLYVLRLLAGAAATRTVISPWLSSFAIFLFLSLAIVKRFSELSNLRERGGETSHGRGYHVSDLEQIRSFGTSSAYAAVVVFSLYISRPDVFALYRHSGRLWFIVPFLLFWLNRVWLLASRGELNEDPVIFALEDGVSLAVAVCIGVIALLAI
jgi:4-hydroxybenzoate polyprenyltransferase/phosphoserine phosphatase